MKKYFEIQSITKENTNFIKGVAILLILFHNYFRWVFPVTGENEFEFSDVFFFKSISFFLANPLEFFNVFFNFLGHYGVQLFIFISAYGLTVSYNNNKPSYLQFLIHRFDKLYPSFVFAVVAFIIYNITIAGHLISFNTLSDLGIQLTTMANFFPDKAMSITGPWWFYSLIFQFYILFPGLIALYNRYGVKSLLIASVISYILIFICYEPVLKLRLNILHLALGHLPEFCLGIYFATKKNVKISVYILLLSVLLLIIGNTNRYFWPFANIAAAFCLVAFVQYVYRYKSTLPHFFSSISFVGGISLYIFAIHGFIRTPFYTLANYFHSPLASIIIGIIFLLVALLIAYSMNAAETNLRDWIRRPAILRGKIIRIMGLLLLVVGGFAFLFYSEKRLTSSKNNKEELVFTFNNGFETIEMDRKNNYLDTISYEGNFCYLMQKNDSYSKSIPIKFDNYNFKNSVNIKTDLMVYVVDTLTNASVVTEIKECITGKMLEWNSEKISQKNLRAGEWISCSVNYKIPVYYLSSYFTITTYVWNNSPGNLYIDNISVKAFAIK